MKLSITFCVSTLVASTAAAPLDLFWRQVVADGLTLTQIDALTPQFGHAADVNPTGTGNCDGAVNDTNGLPIEVPCSCPPPRATFIQSLAANIAAGHAVNNPSVAVTFPTDNSTASILARFNAASITLQNENGEGVGCPESSTTWTAQAAAIQAGAKDNNAPTAAAPPSSSAPVSASSPATTVAAPASSAVTTASASAPSTTGADGLSLAQIDALTPQFGHDADVNPTGTGNCDGAVDDANGDPILVPCDCPPPRNQFIQDLTANIAAGFAVNNPSVAITFPTDNSTNSILARFNAASVTLQNTNGPGVGCPISSTTWTAQANAIRDGQQSRVAIATTLSVSTESSVSTSPAASSVVAGCPAPEPTPTSSEVPTPSSIVSASPVSSTDVTSADGLSLAQIDALTPRLGFSSGVNPTGTGNCDGAVNGANGQPIEVPCSCPPARDVFIQSLAQDIAAGHAVNNPSVSVSFPTDNSTSSQITRIQSSLVALQNLNGPGQGCPAASTTLSAQLAALQG
ncbi:hypothetical protein EW145_g5000 [Phellinidium pouzarii]|uniref:Uncharacterized protein n=1 Tax=Phellinidium pouzarii TaxID=167371 RepID=A0A4S4L1L0_9AGAM|nr:hypothetical protein EW145_g5000 [Phellinidium pouzarii]